jgi:Protein of unknown function (DUF4238)
MSRPRRHHYVTRAYLRGFTEREDGQLYCYGRGRTEPFRAIPDELANQRDFYSTRRADGTWDDSLEMRIEREIESPGLPVLADLLNSKTSLSWEKRDRLSLFVAFQRLRVPHMRRLFDDAYKEMLDNLIKNYEEKEQEIGGDPGPMRVRSFGLDRSSFTSAAEVTKETLLELRDAREISPENFSLNSLMETSHSMASVIRRMKWTVHYATGTERFITCDCPVLLVFDEPSIKVAGLVRPDAELQFPLSAKVMLSMRHDLYLIDRVKKMGRGKRSKRLLDRTPEISVTHVNDEYVRELNNNQAAFSMKWVFSGSTQEWLAGALTGPSRNHQQTVTQDGNLYSFSTLHGQPD